MKKLIENILNDELVIKPNIKYIYQKHEIEVVFIENSEYNQYLIDEKISHKYLFDNKHKKHLLIVTEDKYQELPSLFSELVIKATLRVFVNRKKTRDVIRPIVFIIGIITLLANIFILRKYPFKEVFFVPIISVIILFLLFRYASKLMDELYFKDQQKTREHLLKALPDLAKDLAEDKKKN
ncbi:MAG: hypothetical protein ACOX56_00100 [Acholeplasmataceae bacterium]